MLTPASYACVCPGGKSLHVWCCGVGGDGASGSVRMAVVAGACVGRRLDPMVPIHALEPILFLNLIPPLLLPPGGGFLPLLDLQLPPPSPSHPVMFATSGTITRWIWEKVVVREQLLP